MLHNDPPPSKRPWASDDEAWMLLHRGARHGPWERARYFVALVLSGLILAGAAWWFWPRKEAADSFGCRFRPSDAGEPAGNGARRHGITERQHRALGRQRIVF